jgi:hypothetical protein
MDAALQTRQIESAKTYFERVDKGELPFQLFTSDFEFFFPKYGVGRGPEEFREFASGLWSAGLKSQHHRDELKYMASGRHVIVEGATVGSDAAGRTWNGGDTPGGRFCSVFDFNGEKRFTDYSQAWLAGAGWRHILVVPETKPITRRRRPSSAAFPLS